jgi:translation initiation factor 2 subunit 1
MFPNPRELVLVEITEYSEFGIRVNLIDYNNIKGMVLLSEFSRRQIDSFKMKNKIGKLEIVRVIRVDKIGGYIDLSKSNITSEEKNIFITNRII